METRKCKACDLVLVQRPDETHSAFLKRVYCDIKCAREGQRKAGHWRQSGWMGTPGNYKWKDR